MDKQISAPTPISCVIREFLPSGANVSLADGRPGFIPLREFFWSRKISPEEELEIGQCVEALVIGYDENRKKVVVSSRRADSKSWGKACRSIRRSKMVVHGVVVETRTDRVYVSVGEVECTLTAKEVPLDQFPKLKNHAKHLSDVLHKGDQIRALVTHIDEKHKEIRLSISKYLDRQSSEKYAQSKQKRGFGLAELLELPRSVYEIEQPDAEAWTRPSFRGERIFLLENDDDHRTVLARLLETWKLRVCTDVDELREEEHFNLYIVEVYLDQGELICLEIARSILADHPEARILVLTSCRELEALRRIRSLGKQLYGVVFTPIDANHLAETLRAALQGKRENLRDLLDMADDYTKVSLIDAAAGDGRPLPAKVEELLENLEFTTGAEAGAVFRLIGDTDETQLIGSRGIAQTQFENVRPNLPRSPVSDVVLKGEEIFEGMAKSGYNSGKYNYLRPILPEEFESCIGIRIPLFPEYAIFLFHTRGNFFKGEQLWYARSATALVGSVLEHEEMRQTANKWSSVQLVGHLATAMAHEMHTRLSALGLQAKLLDEIISPLEPDAPMLSSSFEDLGYTVDVLGRTSQKLSDLVDLFFRISATSEEECWLKDICVDAQRALASQFKRAKAELSMEDAYGHLVKVNKDWIEQILVNLIQNALNHMGLWGYEHGSVRFEIQYDEGKDLPLLLTVTDDGVGIHYSEFEDIFRLKYTTRGGGAGVGLYVCKLLTQLMGGRIQVQHSFRFCETSFLVQLPDKSVGKTT